MLAELTDGSSIAIEAIAIPLLFVTGCAVGPNYQRPVVPAPVTFRAPEPLPADQAASLADLKWFEVFKDPELQKLVRTGLAQNYDLLDAVKQNRVKLEEMKKEELPKELQELKPAERKEYLKKIDEKRENLRKDEDGRHQLL